MTKKIFVLLTMILGIISFISKALDWLALTDIWKGQEDVVMEWKVVTWGFVPQLLFIVLALVLIYVLSGKSN